MSGRESPTRVLADESTLLGTSGGGSVPSRPRDEIPGWIGRFVVLGVLGRGGMGVVVSAYDPELDRKVAIKLVGRASDGTEARQRMKREAQALAKLAHPNVIAVYDVGELDQGLYIAMEHVEGSDLAQWLKTPRPLPQVLERFIEAGRGLAAAHAEGLVHRDFKPANVLVGRDGRVRVVDFGLARRDGLTLDTSEASESAEVWSSDVTRAGVVMGTPAYMAPEQSRGEEVDGRCDQFSFCVALWEAASGTRPFPHRNAEARRTAIAQGRVRETERPIPRWLRQALLRGMAPNPQDRHRDMNALLDQLQRAPARRRLLVLGVGAVAVLGAAASLVVDRSDRAAVCEDGEAQIAEAYDAHDRERIVESLSATSLAMAPEVATRATARLDELASRWAAVHRETCEATLVRKERSQGSFDETLSCLADVRRQVERRVELLREADAALTPRALDLLDSIASPDGCATPSTLARRRSLEPPPQLQQGVDALEQRRDALVTRHAVTRSFPELEAAWTDLLTDAETVGHAPLVAKILTHRGNVRRTLGNHDDAEADLARAFATAVGCGDAVLAAELGVRIAYGYDHVGNASETERWLDLASTLVEHTEVPSTQSLELERSRAELLYHSTDTERALQMLEDVLERARQELPSRTRDQFLARTEMTMARTLEQAGRLEESIAASERSTVLLADLVGEHHPRYADSLEYRAAALIKLERGEEALELLQTARQIQQEAGATGTTKGQALMTMQIAWALLQTGRRDEAIEQAEAAVVLMRRSPSLMALGWMLERRCGLLELAGELEAAALACAESLEHARTTDDPKAEELLVYAMTRVGRVSLRRGELPQGRQMLEDAMTLARRDPDATGPRLAFPAGELAWALLLQEQDRPRAEQLAALALQHMEAGRFPRERADLVSRLRAQGLAIR